VAARLAVLTLALLLAPAAARAAARPAAASSCESCHPLHYVTRGSCVACHRGDPSTRRQDLAHHRLLRGAAAAWALPGAPALAEGERLRDALGCRRCHVSGGRGDRLAIALDDVVWRRDQAELRRSIRQPVSTMPDFALSDAQADRLIAVLLRDGDRRGAEERYLVRFRAGGPGGPHPFQRLCGPCHRALTARGPMGDGRAGPDLSGLLTPYYPSADGRRWDRERLRRWLRDPRAERPQAVMPPLDVSDAELEQLVSVLTPASRPDSGAAGAPTPPATARSWIPPKRGNR